MGIGLIFTKEPQFLSKDINPPLHKLMFLKQGGKAEHKLGDITRDTYPAELICISDEDKNHWIGNFAEGMGLFGVKFNKADCREATMEEAIQWKNNPQKFSFENGLVNEIENDNIELE